MAKAKQKITYRFGGNLLNKKVTKLLESETAKLLLFML